mgnify:FL=1
MLLPEQVFLADMGRLRTLIAENDAASLLGASAILRKLLLDPYPLIFQVNKSRLKILFSVPILPDVPPFQPAGVIFMLSPGNIDPTICGPDKLKCVDLKSFLTIEVARIGDRVLSVKDAIDYAANKAGGVHYTDNIKEERLRDYRSSTDFFFVESSPAAIHAIIAISRCTIFSLRPLYQDVLKRLQVTP